MKIAMPPRFGSGSLALALSASAVVLAWAACNPAPTPFVVRGPESPESTPPTLSFLEPTNDLTITQGTRFVIRWTDTDRDSNASIEFQLVRTGATTRISLVQGIPENDDVGLDSVSIGTSAVPPGEYNLVGLIRDEVTTTEVFAMTEAGTVSERVTINVVPPGVGPQTVPPKVTVTQPAFNLSVAQDDFLMIAVQPTDLVPDPNNPLPFDPDSAVQLFVVLDLDLDPNNDDPANDEMGTSDGIIVLQGRSVGPEEIGPLTFNIRVDLETIPPRPGGEPYFIRITADDLSNPRVHKYAAGQISVVELAAGLVDLAEIGKSKAGARWYGFSPGANTGSTITRIGDFDADGVEDFLLVAQFGNPRNLGLVGEAYVIYGQQQTRFGGAIAVNSVSEAVSGAIFEGPPVRLRPGGIQISGVPRTDGITSASFIRDLSGDGRPEILFGLSRVFGAFEAQDFDPGDEDPTQDQMEDVTITFAQGRLSTTIGDGDPSVTNLYTGIDDVTISSATPTISAGSSPDLTWRNDPAANTTEWTLIKFRNILPNIPDIDEPFVIDFSSIDAMLEFRVFNTGGPATLHLLTADFTEQTTFSTFAGRGGPPVADVDYLAEVIGTIDADSAEVVTVDISDFVRLLIDGVLSLQGNELRFILVPAANEDAINQSGVRSSEFGVTAARPALNLTYSRTSAFGARGCYPDPWVNNQTTPPNDPDLSFYAGGMAIQFNSQNRDNSSVTGVNETRLESTVATLELVGQEPGWALDGSDVNDTSGGIFARADNSAADNLGNEDETNGRISGARFVAGWYDYIDHRSLRQGAREDLFGQSVASIGDLNNDGLDEIVISSPRNERYLNELLVAFGAQSTQFASTAYTGSIVVIPGFNYNSFLWREKDDEDDASSSIPVMFEHRFPPPYGNCSSPTTPRYPPTFPADSFEVFAEDPDDMLGGAQSAGDFNQDGLDDILCGAYLNDRPGREDSGAAYILYGRNVLGDFRLTNAENVLLRPPMLRIRGVKTGDQIGWRQSTGLDVNGDRLDDVFIAGPRTDYGGVTRTTCGGDFNRDGLVDAADFSTANFDSCQRRFREREQDLFSDDFCKVFDYDNDFDIDIDDDAVVTCLRNGGTNCCANLVDNGFVGIIFGGVFTDGDRDITQIGTPDLMGTIFYGSGAGFRAGYDVSSAGDFNQDGFGDLLIAVPGETRLDRASRPRVGVVYLVFGGTHLINTEWNLSEVGTPDLPGIVFLSPYVRGRPNEAPPLSVAFLGDVNQDGFGDICIGNPRADFIDLSFPQGPEAPSGDAAVGRRRNAGDAYLVYGNNFGTNRSTR